MEMENFLRSKTQFNIKIDGILIRSRAERSAFLKIIILVCSKCDMLIYLHFDKYAEEIANYRDLCCRY